MALTRSRAKKDSTSRSARRNPRQEEPSQILSIDRRESSGRLVADAFDAERGWSKAHAARLFHRIAAASPLSYGQVRAELIPDSSWKRARKTLGPQASQTTARLGRVLALAGQVWGNEKDAMEWLNSPHPELRGETPFSLLRTEAGGRAVESLLAALEFSFPA